MQPADGESPRGETAGTGAASERDIIARLGSGDPNERLEAVAELAQSTLRDADNLLFEATEDPDPDVAATALDALAEREDARARDIVLRRLHESRPELRLRAVRTAGLVDIRPNVTPAWSALNGRLWVERMAGSAALARAGVGEALPAIISLARRARETNHLSAEAHLLGSAALLGDQAAIQAFLARLTAKSRESRMSALAFLEARWRFETMAHITGAARLREALQAGRLVQAASAKPGYARVYDRLLARLRASTG